MIDDFLAEFQRYKGLAENAAAQVGGEELNHIVHDDGNSIAMLFRHMGGNLTSRFTDFLTTDGEKPWRLRDGEFEDRPFADRTAMLSYWNEAWDVVFREVGALTDADLQRTVTIRGIELTVHAALCRSIAHIATHAGQVVLLARMLADGEWRWLSVPKGGSSAYNANPTLEKPPGPPEKGA